MYEKYFMFWVKHRYVIILPNRWQCGENRIRTTPKKFFHIPLTHSDKTNPSSYSLHHQQQELHQLAGKSSYAFSDTNKISCVRVIDERFRYTVDWKYEHEQELTITTPPWNQHATSLNENVVITAINIDNKHQTYCARIHHKYSIDAMWKF